LRVNEFEGRRVRVLDLRTTRKNRLFLVGRNTGRWMIDHMVSSEQSSPSIAFGNLTISRKETHGFASLLRNRFAFIVCNQING